MLAKDNFLVKFLQLTAKLALFQTEMWDGLFLSGSKSDTQLHFLYDWLTWEVIDNKFCYL